MRISELVLDGFKSYATRTVISGFDSEFNAITGLNGSGKSNILDAICFVLGISNLSQVRASSLQELVYKQGQAGVTKASVTIVFNNEDKAQSPVGYEQYDKITVTRQVVIGGRNKYLINGHNAQQSRVQNLFHSVQLNVNNPHFLIMQGRITKVLNMKPQEILGMIEEAAGTRMFESKKLAAIKTIEKKQKKVDEIKKILADEITPTLEGLRKERTAYMQWKNNQGEIEWHERVTHAQQFHKAEQALAAHEQNAQQLAERIAQLDAQSEQLEQQLRGAEDELNEAKQAHRDANAEAAASLSQLVDETPVDADDDDEDEDDDDDDGGENEDEADADADADDKPGKKKRKAGAKAGAKKRAKAQSPKKKAAVPDDALEALEQRASSLAQRLAKHESTLAYRREALASEEAARAALEKAMRDGVSQKESLQSAVTQADEQLSEARAAHESAQSELAALQRRYQAVSTGLGNDDAGDEAAAAADEGESDDKASAAKKTLAQQLRDAERDVAESKRELKQANVTVKHLTKELKERRKRASGANASLDKLKAEHEKLMADVDEKRRALDALGFDETRERELTARERELDADVQKLRERAESVAAALSHAQFTYTKPSASFDDSKVKGLVADLVRVNDPKYAAALEVIAGSRLYNVVVDDERTGQELLERGRLRKRVTIIPLSKIAPRPVPSDKVQRAEQLVGKENVGSALSYVAFEPEVRAAMEYVFGNSLVCADASAAKTVAFDKAVRSKCVTLDGDRYDPAGTLTGGARRNGGQMLAKLQQLNEARDALRAAESELATVRAELQRLRGDASAAHRDAKKAWELATHKASLVEARIGQNATHQEAESLRAMEDELAAAEASLETLAARERAGAERCKALAAAAAEANKTRDEQLKALDQQIKAAKKRVTSAKKALASAEARAEQARAELEAAGAEAATMREQAAAAVGAIADAEAAVERAQATLAAANERAGAINAALDAERKRRKAAKSQLAKLAAAHDAALAKRDDAQLERKQAALECARLDKTRDELQAQVDNMLKAHHWIASEKQFFGKKNTDYDFSPANVAKIEARLAQLREAQDALARSINKKVMAMFDKAEAEYQSLNEKKTIIEKDKAKIEAVIGDLDEKKSDALAVVWRKVNKDFGSIFSALLPGAMAKLEPPAGMELTEGLAIMVGFNDVWKNLTELSGGQRSLLALSLILALMLFKPAPVLLLDECDSALDPSHTQNVGSMIKKHFKHSQFIIISLKEGMFNNANCIFRTSFRDGTSSVTRTQNA